MTTQPPNPSAPAASPAAETRDPVAVTAPLREWGALLLVVATAVFLFFALLDLVLGARSAITFGVTPGFAIRADVSFDSFAGPVTIFFPLVGVLLATHVKPAAARARLISLLALIVYGVATLLAVISLLIAFLHQATTDGQLIARSWRAGRLDERDECRSAGETLSIALRHSQG